MGAPGGTAEAHLLDPHEIIPGKDAHAPALGSHSPTCNYPVWASDLVLSVPAAKGTKGNTRLVPESRAGLVFITGTP